MDKQTLIVVGASTAIGFLGDVATYSVAASKGGSFKVVIPKGKELLSVLALGIIGGFVIDWAVKKIDRSLMSESERSLSDLYEKEIADLRSGVKKGIPLGINWTAPSLT